MKRGETIILADGEFPCKDGAAWRLLSAAKRVVACDGAAITYRRRFHRWPTVIVGDLDSLGSRAVRTEVVRVADQSTNDLDKAIALCRERGWNAPIIVGATGKREDHMLGNVFRAYANGIEIVTDHGRFVPVVGRRSFKVAHGAAVSIFAADPLTRVSSHGLEWPLDDVRFDNLYCATLNRAIANRVVLESSLPIYVFFEERP